MEPDFTQPSFVKEPYVSNTLNKPFWTEALIGVSVSSIVWNDTGIDHLVLSNGLKLHAAKVGLDARPGFMVEDGKTDRPVCMAEIDRRRELYNTACMEDRERQTPESAAAKSVALRDVEDVLMPFIRSHKV